VKRSTSMTVLGVAGARASAATGMSTSSPASGLAARPSPPPALADPPALAAPPALLAAASTAATPLSARARKAATKTSAAAEMARPIRARGDGTKSSPLSLEEVIELFAAGQVSWLPGLPRSFESGAHRARLPRPMFWASGFLGSMLPGYSGGTAPAFNRLPSRPLPGRHSGTSDKLCPRCTRIEPRWSSGVDPRRASFTARAPAGRSRSAPPAPRLPAEAWWARRSRGASAAAPPAAASP